LRARRAGRDVGVRRPQQGADPRSREGARGFAREGHRGRHVARALGTVTAWCEPAAGVRVRTGRCMAMNSTRLVAAGHALLVDAGVVPSELDDIAAVVAAEAPRFERVALAFTHPHWDHVLARPWFPGATTFAHAGFADEVERDADAI